MLPSHLQPYPLTHLPAHHHTHTHAHTLNARPQLARLAASGLPVICVEARHVSMRISTAIPTADDLADAVVRVLDELGVQKVRACACACACMVGGGVGWGGRLCGAGGT